MRDKAKKAFIIAIPVLLALIGGILLLYELDARQVPPLVNEEKATPDDAPALTAQPLPAPTAQETPASQYEPAEAAKASVRTSDATLNPSTIHIRGKSYPLKWNIEESTLKKHIGWMDTSAKPGEVGVCVVMGHRNQQLRCLKDVERGDVITIVDANGAAYPYTVERGEIVTDNNITFGATDRRVLVLITCYPFFYSGSAPHQYVVTAIDGRAEDG